MWPSVLEELQAGASRVCCAVQTDCCMGACYKVCSMVASGEAVLRQLRAIWPQAPSGQNIEVGASGPVLREDTSSSL